MARRGSSAPTNGSLRDYKPTMVSTRQRAHSEKAVVTQTQGLPRDEAVQPATAGGGQRGDCLFSGGR